MVRLAHYNYTHLPHLAYDLDAMQITYTATVEHALQRLRQRNLRNDFSAIPVTIFYGKHPAGFFVLDAGPDRLDFWDRTDCVLLRSLSVNPALQRMGIGLAAMQQLPEFVRGNYPAVKQILLAVNAQNTAAIRLYERTGYTFNGRTREGRSGLQLFIVSEI